MQMVVSFGWGWQLNFFLCIFEALFSPLSFTSNVCGNCTCVNKTDLVLFLTRWLVAGLCLLLYVITNF